jgi:hypothetical protein
MRSGCRDLPEGVRRCFNTGAQPRVPNCDGPKRSRYWPEPSTCILVGARSDTNVVLAVLWDGRCACGGHFISVTFYLRGEHIPHASLGLNDARHAWVLLQPAAKA